MWEVVVWGRNLQQGGDVMFNAKFVSADNVAEAEKRVWCLKICLPWTVGVTRLEMPRRKLGVQNMNKKFTLETLLGITCSGLEKYVYGAPEAPR